MVVSITQFHMILIIYSEEKDFKGAVVVPITEVIVYFSLSIFTLQKLFNIETEKLVL